MDFMKKRKIKKWVIKHKKLLIGSGIFAGVGLIGGLIGFEIAASGHAIRNWLASPWAPTFFICLVLGLFILGMVIAVVINIKRGGND